MSYRYDYYLLFTDMEMGGTQRLDNWPKVSQLFSGATGIQI